MISFNRGPWCDLLRARASFARPRPSRNRRGRRRRDLHRAGDRQICRANLQATRGVPFRVLTDVDLGYALGLGLVVLGRPKVMDMYRGFGIDLAQFQGNGGWFLPIPATLVVGRDSRVKARFVDPDFRHRMPTEDIVEAVREAAQG